MKSNLRGVFVLGLCALGVYVAFGTTHLNQVHANMSSDNYEIQFGNFNITSGTKTKEGGSYTMTDTVGQTAPGLYGTENTSGYIVKAGFQYIKTIGQFSFVLSNTAVSFGELTPNSFSIATTSARVSAKGAGGYTVYVSQNHPLKKINQTPTTTIPNTTCNAGTCTINSAQVWTNAQQHGFGYGMTGTDIASDFIDRTYFRPFADYSSNQPPQIIMSNSGAVKNRTGQLTYKISISGSQAAGDYENAITFIAVPGY